MLKSHITLAALVVLVAGSFQLLAQSAPPPTIRPMVTVNGVPDKNKITAGSNSPTMKVDSFGNAEEKDFIVRALGTLETGKEWKEYSFTFTPQKSGYLWMSLLGQYPAATEANKDLIQVDYDKISVTGGTLENGDFETIEASGKPKFWAYAKAVLPVGSKSALSGNRFVTASSNSPIGVALMGTAGQPVTVTLNARAHSE